MQLSWASFLLKILQYLKAKVFDNNVVLVMTVRVFKVREINVDCITIGLILLAVVIYVDTRCDKIEQSPVASRCR